jgi:phage tail sheath protein FI
MPQLTYPGVYFEEFAPAPPIEGVGTSTPAFLGPAVDGPPREPVRITSFEQFKEQFGDAPPSSGLFLWYAVQGFFQNGGRDCYVVRVSNAKFDETTLDDIKGKNTIHLRARAGDVSPNLKVTVKDDAHAVDKATARISRPEASFQNASGTEIIATQAADAATFRPADIVTWQGNVEPQAVEVLRIEDSVIRLVNPLSQPYSGAARKVRLADFQANQTKGFRVEGATTEKLSAGSVITLEQGGTATDPRVVSSVVDQSVPGGPSYRVEIQQPLNKTFSLAASAAAISVESTEFNISVSQNGTSLGNYAELSMNASHPKFFRAIINRDQAGAIDAEPVFPPNFTPPPDDRPKAVTDKAISGGTAENVATLTSSDYKDALARLDAIDDVNMVAIPDRSDMDVQLAMIAHCTRLHDRFAILDSQPDAPLFGTDSVEAQRAGVETPKGFAALYYPWLEVADASGNGTVLVPPSGHVAGVYARIDNMRGVHKAPAGTETLLENVLGVERTMSNDEQGILNLRGINVIRVFVPGGRALVWGARTTASDKNFQYVNVRRLFLFLEESIEEGIKTAVFEPNNFELWQKLKRTLTDFLTRVWRGGALFGATPEDAFYVDISERLNPVAEQRLGRLNIEIGLRPSYPAEFIVVRIGITQDTTEITEV